MALYTLDTLDLPLFGEAARLAARRIDARIDLGFTTPHASLVLTPAHVLEEAPLVSARQVAWQSMLMAESDAVAVVESPFSQETYRITCIYSEGLPRDIERGLEIAEKQAIAGTGEPFAYVYFAPIASSAIWFPERDRVIIIGPPHPAPRLERWSILSEAQFLRALRESYHEIIERVGR